MASGDAKRLLPIIARAFAELGYRRATTAALARRCGVRENVLYRAWPSKKDMFLAAIDHVWDHSMEIWQRLLDDAGPGAGDPPWVILAYESTHHGETGLYRLIFAALTESRDAQIAAGLRRMYRSFHAFIARQIASARTPHDPAAAAHVGRPTDELTAWGVLGLATIASITLELDLLSNRQRAMLFTHLARRMVDPGRAEIPHDGK